ncbi:DUF2946 family protein [Sedimentitalea nanhaiensis]|uniref:DUF2946 family protein n=1 Tax=Sedimentitalea nanhaiensis TaxID=999627 RepID=UPI0004048B31|nr:DUF2946 family protein [Sedimentitalea nanhaiensis]
MVCILALLMQILLPMGARAAGGTWIEICGEAGAERVRVIVPGNAPAPVTPGCADCGPCVLCATITGALVPESVMVRLMPQAIIASFSTVPDEIVALDARFRPTNRGPPATNAVYEKMDFCPWL